MINSSPKNEETLPVLYLEQPKPKNEGIPGWAKAAIIGGSALAGILVIGGVVYGTLTAPVNTYKDLLNKQYQDFLKKTAGYTSSNPNGFTPAQEQSIAYETTIMAQTAQGLANASKTLTDLGALAINNITILVGIGLAAGIAISAAKVFPTLKARSGKPIQTAPGMSNATIMTFADYFAANGYPIEAANIMASARTIFQTYDRPVMVETVNSLTYLLPSLVGAELYIAQLQIQALTFEMAKIPTWLVMPLPI